jgi:hypothetical protein
MTTKRLITAIAASVAALLLQASAAKAEERSGETGNRGQGSSADAPLLKQPSMPMRRTTHKQREDAAAKHKAMREADARGKGQAVPAARTMPKPQRLPESRDNK